jgi:hypothetical protein
VFFGTQHLLCGYLFENLATGNIQEDEAELYHSTGQIGTITLLRSFSKEKFSGQ